MEKVAFCRYLLNSDARDVIFLSKILWTDESKFSREGITNLHYWAEENPHLKKRDTFSDKI